MTKKKGINPFKIVSSAFLVASIIYSVVKDNKRNK
jgi:hypothetical protein